MEVKWPPKFAEDGIQFECQGSGKCCVSHGEFGSVYLSPDDRIRMAESLKLTVEEFQIRYCEKTEGNFYRLIENREDKACIFLEKNRCTVYKARPTQCRTWPFWPEVMNAKSWKKDVASFCPGVGKGKVWSVDEMTVILREQIAEENAMFAEAEKS